MDGVTENLNDTSDNCEVPTVKSFSVKSKGNSFGRVLENESLKYVLEKEAQEVVRKGENGATIEEKTMGQISIESCHLNTAASDLPRNDSDSLKEKLQRTDAKSLEIHSVEDKPKHLIGESKQVKSKTVSERLEVLDQPRHSLEDPAIRAKQESQAPCFVTVQTADSALYTDKGIGEDFSKICLERNNIAVIARQEIEESNHQIVSIDRNQRNEFNNLQAKGNEIVCRICTATFPARRDFTDHLAAKHFQAELYKQIEAASNGTSSCPSCSVFSTKNIALLTVHYGARCKPFPVNRLYLDWVDKAVDHPKSQICTFCGEKNLFISDLCTHLIDKHVAAIMEKMGFMFLFKQEQVKTVMGVYTQHYCPLCDRTESDRNLCIHFIKNHTEEFLASYQEYTASLVGNIGVLCHLCLSWHGTAMHCLEHLALVHFSQELLSECGFSPDLMLACNSCNYVSRTEKDMILHYGIDHQRVDFFYTQEIVKLHDQGKVIVSGSNSLKIEKCDPKDFTKLVSLMGTFSTSDELSVRSVLLDRTSTVYKSILQYISKDPIFSCYNCNICDLELKREDLMVAHVGLRPHFKADIQLRVEASHKARDLTCKLCDSLMPSFLAFWDHQASNHFFDDLAADIGEKDSRSSRFNCPEQHCTFSGESLDNVVKHLGRSHEKVRNLYSKMQVTAELLKCRLCSKDQRNFQDMKAHLLREHFGADFLSDYIVRSPDGSMTCSLCMGFENTCNLDLISTHIGMIHNTVEELYMKKLSGESFDMSKGHTYTCELCGWSIGRKEQFLNHITLQHCMQMLTQLIKRSIVRNDSGREFYKCPTCYIMFNTIRDYRNHVGKDLHCNQSLGFYYWQVDYQNHKIPNPQLLSSVQAWDRLQCVSTPISKYLKSAFSELSRIETEDPQSSEIEMVYNPYSCNLEIVFKENLPPNSFKPMQVVNSDIYQCFFCNMSEVDLSYTETDKSMFLIHLAETHFHAQLVKMFTVIREGVEYMECSLCTNIVVFENIQDLFEHCVSSHDVIDGIYEAAKPKNPPNFTGDVSEFLARDQLILSSLYPWLPISIPEVKSSLKDTIIEESARSRFSLDVADNLIKVPEKNGKLQRMKRKFLEEDLERKRRKSGC